jgi:fructosamine-3-kinase
MSQDADISWQVLRSVVRPTFGPDAELEQVQPLVGGCINTTLKLHLADGRRAVIKIAPHRVTHAFVDEAHQLHQLRAAGVPVPQVYDAQVGSLDSPHSYILMEFVDGVDLHAAREHCSADDYDDVQRELADVVWRVHARTGDAYCRVLEDPARCKPHEKWPAFYRETYDAIWSQVQKSAALPIKCRKAIGKLHDKLDRLLAHDDCPRLVHWDLWSANVLVRRDPRTDKMVVAAVIDPNCKYAHAEAELAYLELFHTVTPAFKQAYQRHHHVNGQYHNVRRPIYQLYELLNHVLLFGQEYVPRTVATVERLAAVV